MISDAVAELSELLLKNKYTVSLAESCTGGMVAKLLTDAPGASGFFLGCAVVYSNASKEKLLNVPRETLERYGAVSAETAETMAEGTKRVFGSDIAAAVTGIAGPGGGTPLKPVGTVFVAVTDGMLTASRQLSLKGSRDDIRSMAAEGAILLITETINARKK